jgi:O-methyltransferase
MKKIIKKLLHKAGYSISKIKINPYPIDYNKYFIDEYKSIEPYTMTSIDRIYALKTAIEYTVNNNIEGSYVECGVWKGGSCMLIAKTLIDNQRIDKEIWLYDTFEGMTNPTDEDIEVETNLKGMELLKNIDRTTDKLNMWAYAPKDLVIQNMDSTGFPGKNIKYIEGKVEDTLSKSKPKSIALLRLDTDWYESTKIELEILYPLLVDGGILIIDDYGHFKGAKKAVDEYFRSINEKPLMHRIDYSGRMIVKKQ